jgi:hypothetical protein
MSTDPIYRPGDMQDMFSSIYDRFNDRYNITVHSTEPWVVTFDNFISDDEVHALLTTVHKWERSTDVGSTNEFGESGRVLSQGRTSSNAWCTHDCENHPLVQDVMSRIEEVTYVPRENYESFQVLRYDVGQKYTTHHDYGSEDLELGQISIFFTNTHAYAHTYIYICECIFLYV